MIEAYLLHFGFMAHFLSGSNQVEIRYYYFALFPSAKMENKLIYTETGSNLTLNIYQIIAK